MFEFDDDVLDEMTQDDAAREPILVGFYSGGFYPEEGRALLTDVMETAKKHDIKDTLILDHPDGYGMKGSGYEPYPGYIDRLVEEIDKEPSRKGRPLLLLGHSRGGCPAMAVATRLGSRVLKVYLLSCSGMEPGKPTGWEGLAEHFKTGGDELILAWLLSMQPGNKILTIALETSKDPKALQELYDDGKWLRNMVELTRLQYREAMFPDMSSGIIDKIQAPIMAISPLQDPGAQPEMMQSLDKLAGGEFELKTVNAGHMDILQATKANKKKGIPYKFELGELLGPDFEKFLPRNLDR